jgi:phage terminase large subunit
MSPAATQVEIPEAFVSLFEPSRYKVYYSGRGAAKSWSFAAALLLAGAQRKLRILCARETQRSIADSVHALLSDSIERMGLESFYTIQQSTILGANGTEFIFAGLRTLTVAQIKSLEGIDIAWVEEAQVVTKRSWDILIPTIRKEGSEIWVSFNPELETDDTYTRFVLNSPPGAVVRKVSWRDNPWFPDVLRIEKDHLQRVDPKAYEHVWEGETKAAVEGAIFGEEMMRATEENRIGPVPYDRTKPVDTFWDLGYGDAMAIWFMQSVAGWYHAIDYLTNHGKAIDWYQIQLQQRGYVYGTHWLPHDAVNTIIHQKLANQDKSRSIEMLMREAGFNVRLIPMLHVTDQINAARTMIPQCRFDQDKCHEGLRALRSYQWGPLTALGVQRREPLHDWASHGASAFMGASVMLKHPERALPPKPKPRPAPVSAWS